MLGRDKELTASAVASCNVSGVSYDLLDGPGVFRVVYI
jgi:hypothetical protein